MTDLTKIIANVGAAALIAWIGWWLFDLDKSECYIVYLMTIGFASIRGRLG